MKFETIRTLPRSSLLAKLSNQSCYRGDQDTDDHSGWAPWSYMEMGETNRRTNITATIQQSGLDGKVTKLKLLLSKDTWNSDWNLQTYTQITLKKLSEYEKKYIFWSDEPQCLIHVWGKQSNAYHLHNTIPTMKHGGGSIMQRGCSSAAGSGEVIREDGKLNAT